MDYCKERRLQSCRLRRDTPKTPRKATDHILYAASVVYERTAVVYETGRSTFGDGRNHEGFIKSTNAF